MSIPTSWCTSTRSSTFNALEQAHEAGIRTAVLASSGSIHGTAWARDWIDVPYVPVDEHSPTRYTDLYALTKDLLERTGAMFARRGMSVTALRLHWLLTREEATARIDNVPELDNARDLWGNVDLSDAARACLLSLAHRADIEGFETFVIAADGTLSTRPTAELLDQHFPQAHRNKHFTGGCSAFDTRKAQSLLGWRPTA
jgi:UDP-glucose 4-epimerase